MTDPGAEVTFAGITLSQIGDYDLVVTALDAVPFEGAIGATDDQPASVTGRYVFYNNSSFDGNDVGANVNDDGAIAPDPLSAGDALGKTALLPGGTADFRNYTSYSRGINGIMVDIEGLPQGVTALDAGDDFTFRVGNSSDLNSWSTAAPPESITLRGSEGQPTRVTIIWTDGEIQNEWLEVTVKDTDSTGLAEADVFYFGNITGETGDDGADALVTYSDLIETRNDINLTSVVDVDNKFDFNRDTYIDYSDLILCRNNINLSAGLNLITVPGVVPLEPEGSIGEALLHDAAIQDVAKANPAATGFPAPDTSLAELMWFYGQEQLTARNLSSAEYGQAESAVDKLLATWP